MIRLTEIGELVGSNEKKHASIYVPADIVVRVWMGKTLVDYGNSCYTVSETPEEVARKVLEYRLLTEQYKAACVKSMEDADAIGVSNLVEFQLSQLAGLEEPKDER